MGDVTRRRREIALEREFVKRARAGDDAAFGELFSLYRAPIFKICLQRLGTPGLAEDALQETFMRAFRALRGFDATRRLFPWLTAIALNVSTDLWQKQARLAPTGLASSLDDELPQAADVADGVVESERVRVALAKLPPGQRRRLMLHDVAGWQCADLVDSECATEPAVRSSLFRARARMRSMLRGLPPVWTGLRRNRDRTVLQFQRLTDIGGAELGSGLLAFSLTALLAFAAPSATGPFSSVRVGKMRSANNRSLVAPWGVPARETPPGETQMNSSPRASIANPKTPVNWSKSFHRAGNDRVAPASGNFGVEIVDQDGSVIFFTKSWFKCDDVFDVRSKTRSSPVRAAC
jgi:RNA polymerase sigma factor (sigma-70 family)